MKDLKASENLAKHHFITLHRPFYQKSIILNVPEVIDENYIKEAIEGEYITKKDDFRLLRNQPSRSRGEKNWIVLLVPSLLRAIIKDRGLLLGPSKYLTRPLTTVQRCQNCLAFGHNERSCRNDSLCQNCGQIHQERTCKNPTMCINCKEHNKKYGTNFKTNHKSSIINCPTYQQIYSYERQKLNEQYLHFTPRGSSFVDNLREDEQRSSNIHFSHISRNVPLNEDIPPFQSYPPFFNIDGFHLGS